MLSKNKIKYIQSLHLKKNRDISNSFITEGDKIVRTAMAQKPNLIEEIFAIEKWFMEHKNNSLPITVVTDADMAKLTNLKTPPSVLAIVKMENYVMPQTLQNEWAIVLSDIQDPGNMGTIIRLADWFGVQHIFCSEATVDCYNAKVVQSAMGSLWQVQIHYTDIDAYIKNNTTTALYVAMLNGESIHNSSMPKPPGFLVIGNEGQGVAQALLENKHQAITIPKFGQAESLNAAVAAGILLSHFVKL